MTVTKSKPAVPVAQAAAEAAAAANAPKPEEVVPTGVAVLGNINTMDDPGVSAPSLPERTAKALAQVPAQRMPCLELARHLKVFVDVKTRSKIIRLENGLSQLIEPASMEEARYWLSKKDANGLSAFRISKRRVEDVPVPVQRNSGDLTREDIMGDDEGEDGDFIGGRPTRAGADNDDGDVQRL